MSLSRCPDRAGRNIPVADSVTLIFPLFFRRLKPVSKGADGQWRRYEFLFKPSKDDIRDAASVGTDEVYDRYIYMPGAVYSISPKLSRLPSIALTNYRYRYR